MPRTIRAYHSTYRCPHTRTFQIIFPTFFGGLYSSRSFSFRKLVTLNDRRTWMFSKDAILWGCCTPQVLTELCSSVRAWYVKDPHSLNPNSSTYRESCSIEHPTAGIVRLYAKFFHRCSKHLLLPCRPAIIPVDCPVRWARFWNRSRITSLALRCKGSGALQPNAFLAANCHGSCPSLFDSLVFLYGAFLMSRCWDTLFYQAQNVVDSHVGPACKTAT